MVFNRTSDDRPLSLEEIRKRANLLVIDDHAVPFLRLFERDGYNIQRWVRVENLSDLTEGRFDLILLDMHGIAVKDSPVQHGLGILKHIKETDPAQLVIAYSAQDWSPSTSDFFRMADAVLDKTAQYVDYKALVDQLLQRRFSAGYFVSLVNGVLADKAAAAPRAVAKSLKAIRTGNTSRLSSYLKSKIQDEKTIDRVLAIISIAITVLR